MKLGTSVTISAAALLVSALGGWLAVSCAHRDGIAVGQRMEHDAGTDRANAARAVAVDSSATAWQRRLDSLARANSAARALPRVAHRSDSAAVAIAAVPDSVVPKSQALAAIAAKDTTIGVLLLVIDQDSVGIRARDGEILRLIGAVRFYADTAVPQLERDRDWWKARASSPCGLGGAIGLGIRGADAVAGFTCRLTVRLPFLH